MEDKARHGTLAERGYYVELCCFRSECYLDADGLREPSNAERVETLLALLDAGYARQFLLPHDICAKMQRRRHGGMGYDHLPWAIAPHLLLVGNPTRLLSDEDAS